MKFGRLLLGAALGAFLCASFAAGLANSAQAAEKVRGAAAVSWPGYSYWEIAKQKGLMPDIDLEFAILEDPLAGHSLLAAGQLDVYISTIDYAPIAAEQGFPVKLVSFTNISYGVDQILLAPGIEPQDLKGKQVAAPQAFIGNLQMGVWLENNGISVDDVVWVNLAADEAVGAMLAGDIAAAYVYEPWATEVIENLEGARRVAHSAEPMFLEGAMFADSIWMSDDFLTNHRDTALKVLKAHWDAVHWWEQNPVEANAIFTDYLRWPSEDIEYVIGADGTGLDVATLYPYDFAEAARFCGVMDGAPPFNQENGQIYLTFELTNEWWKKVGLMQSTVSSDDLIDCSLMKELVDSGYGK
ncbi:MAG: ABC transporter substrate-binding protein, partial [Proteobacteria bacterium]|nr:ABC transporter substrate-binding protein [Pseudomonadota bacterium]